MQSVNGTSPNNPGREKKDAIDVETPESEAGGACGLHKKHERERERKKEKEKERKTSKRFGRRRRPVVRASHRHRMASRFHNVSRKNVPRDLSRRQ